MQMQTDVMGCNAINTDDLELNVKTLLRKFGLTCMAQNSPEGKTVTTCKSKQTSVAWMAWKHQAQFRDAFHGETAVC